MYDIRYPLLKEIGAGKGVDYVTLLNRVQPPSESLSLLKEMRKDGIVNGTFDAYSTVSLTDKGISLLLQLEHDLDEKHKNQAKEERQQRFQNKVSVASVLIPLVTFIFGLIVEHRAGLIEFLASLLF